MNEINLIFDKRPNLIPIYLGALPRKRKGLRSGEKLPIITSELRNSKIDIQHLRKYYKYFEIDDNAPIPISYPLTLIFPLVMPIIGHPEFPLFYIKMIQLRNHVIQHRPLKATDVLDVKCGIITERRVEKGIEMDVLAIIKVKDEPVWENLNTYFFPGRFGEPDDISPLSRIEPLSQKYTEKTLTISQQGAFKFSILCGDYNGIHYNSRYARAMGFERSFAQSNVSLTNCLKNMLWFYSDEPMRLNVAYKGPVYYNRKLTLKESDVNDGISFNLYCEGEKRPSIIGSLYSIKKTSAHSCFKIT